MNNHNSFSPSEPLAYLITWTTYGTWLHGDARGWRRKDGLQSEAPNAFLLVMARSRMKEDAFRLSHEQRSLVEETVQLHCEIRGWTLHAVKARSNHVHVVVTATGCRPQVQRDQFKAWCTRALKGGGAGRSRFWTQGGRCDCINDEAGLENAITYVLEAQDRKDRDFLS